MNNLWKYVKQLDEIIVAVLVALLVISINAQIISRLLRKPITWLGDINLILFIWSIFLGFSIVWKKEEAIAMDSILSIMPYKPRIYIELLIEIVIAAFAFFLFYRGLYLTQTHSFFATPALEWPRSIITAALPVSMFLIFIHSLIKIKNAILDRIIKGKEL